MHITFGGIVFLIVLILVIVGIVWFNSWRKGDRGSLNIHIGKMSRKKKDDNLVACFNDYPDCYKMEYMLKTSVAKGADLIKIGAKQCYMQGWDGKKFIAVHEPKDIVYPTERLARMMGCEPLKKLKSLKFSRWEQLAPFAPVAALLIGTFLFVIIVG